MRQYYRIKEENPDTLLLFRMGDFYETFEEDALRASDVLGIVLTKRGHGATESVALAGFPHHALENHLPKLVDAGLRVAICEQLEDPKATKSLVKRGVTEVVTPGVSLRDQTLSPKQANYLVAVHYGKRQAGVSYADVSTGEFVLTEVSHFRLSNLLQSIEPSEILIDKSIRDSVQDLRNQGYIVTPREDWVFDYDFANLTLLEHFGTHSLKGFGVSELREGIVAAGAVLHYLIETQKGKPEHIKKIRLQTDQGTMLLDPQTRRNLELLTPLHGDSKAMTLVKFLDHTFTAMGARTLRRWLFQPLRDVQRINRRLDAVETLVGNSDIRSSLQDHLKQVCDIERVVARICTQRAIPRELLSLGLALHQVPDIILQLNASECPVLGKLAQALNPCSEVESMIHQALDESSGQIFRSGYSRDLDELQEISSSGKKFIETLQKREIERTGIPSLKVGYNKVFGYYLEITNTHRDKVPGDYVRKQTLVNAERYITSELKEYEECVLGAKEKIAVLENELLHSLRANLSIKSQELQDLGTAIAVLDCLVAFAEVAVRERYVRPELNNSRCLRILDGRHPIVEQSIAETFVPNSVNIDPDKNQILIITGPNMAGKSVVLRQVGLIVLMAQTGSFVPAKKAQIGVVDRIFTRVGASDNLAAGESTFLVEMNETANILNNATQSSLILLDEVGRGTSTFDGLSIAWALVEYLHQNDSIAARTLFATHYHELNALEEQLERVENHRIHVQEHKGKIVFLRKLVRGAADHSYGIEVAHMAGLPSKLLQRAKIILQELESQETVSREISPKIESTQMPLFDEPEPDPLRDRLKEIDPDKITPMQALLLLAELKEQSD
ncbi:MAG: DNA mismatch repair protein MutS [Rhodothermaceae bacterium]|nr:DNA mismatch repair protein MutS [Rhodothermaceae bacterium]MXW32407.1 DNA mismatch repair protein MutS [Rhodothermaceae bacterium]MYC03273.1 DNA mismatch repair protein MutS [Rhodothermaceae bacterium]MYE62883.1 DNA mismatch repair protein MutS [Rhodothermaceae bacterium]MYI17589.1 DNA mismatch repair protein MutS [Rhodothermaceae bacterium]